MKAKPLLRIVGRSYSERLKEAQELTELMIKDDLYRKVE